MSDEDTLTPTPPSTRAGTGADLARRMDRMEQRQDTMETEVRNLSATVARVETNQQHAEELNKLRFDAQKTSLDTLTGTVGAFIARIDGIISGEIETAQSRQGAQIMADYLKWRGNTDDRLDTVEDAQEKAQSRTLGRFDVLSWGKVILLTVAPIAAVLVSIYVALTK